jgi:hypothetical protein
MDMDYNEKARLYAQPFIAGPTQTLMHNVETKMSLVQMGGFEFPLTINDSEYESSYVCSPYNALITYSQDELYKIGNPLLRFLLKAVVGFLSWILKKGRINKNVCINNFLLSTNPYPLWEGEGVAEVLEQYKNLYPSHALMFRSLNDFTNGPLLLHFKSLEFRFIVSRQVYIFDRKLNYFMRRNNTQNDRRTLAKKEFKLIEHEEITPEDFPRIYELYNLLYLEKHSRHNPQFSEALIAYWHKHKILTMKGLRDASGMLQGVVGLFESEAVITAPLVGYNTQMPAKHGLYKILIYLILEYSDTHGRCLNLSSGASHFKLMRGGTPFIEKTAIYFSHLPWYRRMIWHLVGGLANGILIPLLKRYKL